MSRKFDVDPNSDNLEELARALERLHAADGGDSGNTRLTPGILTSPDEPVPAPEGELPEPSEERVELRPKPAFLSRYKLPLPLSALLFRAGMVLLSLALVGVIYYMILQNMKGGRALVVPDLVGQQSPQALKRIPHGLRLVVEYDKQSTKPAGTVLSVSPAPGTRLKRNAQVMVTVAGKADAGTTPTTTTAAPSTGTPSSGESNLTPPRPATGTGAPTTAVPPKPGTTPTTTPTTSTPAPPGTPTRTPIANDFIGMAESKVRAALEQGGVRVVTEQGEDTARDSGVVIAIDPAPGTDVEPGGTVKLTVNNLSRFVTMRNYTGHYGDDVVEDLQRLGMSVTVTREAGGQSGNVLRTDPGTGALLKPGTAVTVVVAQ